LDCFNDRSAGSGNPLEKQLGRTQAGTSVVENVRPENAVGGDVDVGLGRRSLTPLARGIRRNTDFGFKLAH
jgi:hypothetical protein